MSLEIPIDDITFTDRLRQLNRDTVESLKQSIARIGLKTPISVRCIRDEEAYVGVTGLHRYVACRELGQTHIPVRLETGTADDARMWEIAENLHRADLTALERDEHIAEWVRLCEQKKVAQNAPPGGEQPHEKGIRAASRELNLERTDVQRAVKVAEKLAPEAKQAALDLGLDDNRSVLLKAAAEPTPEAQKRKLQEHAAKPRKARTAKLSSDTDDKPADDVPYNKQPGLVAAIRAIAALNYDQRIYLWKYVLPKYNPTGLTAEYENSGDEPADRRRRYENILQLISVSRVDDWPQRDRVEFAIEVLAALGLDLDDLRERAGQPVDLPDAANMIH